MGISQDSQRKDKCSDSCIRFVNPILLPAVAIVDQPGPNVLSAVTKKCDIATQTLPEPLAMQKIAVNRNQCNNTTEKL